MVSDDSFGLPEEVLICIEKRFFLRYSRKKRFYLYWFGGNEMRILVAEGDRNLADMLKKLLMRSGFEADHVENGADAREYLKCGNYDGAIVDHVLVRLSGLDVVMTAREDGVQTPILILTAKTGVEETVRFLDAGANDVVLKPFDVRELTARVRAMTRNNTGQATSLLKIGNVTLDRRNFELSTPFGTVELTGKEFQVIELLMFNPGVLIRTENIFDKIWGLDGKASVNVIWVNISAIRKKLSSLQADVKIRSVRNVGYRIDKI